MVQGLGGSEGEAGACVGSAVFSAGNLGSPIHGWEEVWFCPRMELWEAVWIQSCVMVKPCRCRMVSLGICPRGVVV